MALQGSYIGSLVRSPAIAHDVALYDITQGGHAYRIFLYRLQRIHACVNPSRSRVERVEVKSMVKLASSPARDVDQLGRAVVISDRLTIYIKVERTSYRDGHVDCAEKQKTGTSGVVSESFPPPSVEARASDYKYYAIMRWAGRRRVTRIQAFSRTINLTLLFVWILSGVRVRYPVLLASG